MPYNTAKKVVQQLVDHGYITYFAGGYVRDLVMKHPSDDIDIATSAPIEKVQAIFPKTIPVGVQFGIVIVVMDGHHFEVATFRKESGYHDGRRPNKIEKASPEEDAKRRDFTINGMFYDPIKEEIYDYVEGREDLEKKLIRAVGDPHERFLEDRLRMVRAIRYAARFNFSIEPHTKKAILYHAGELFPAVAIERVWQELKKMCAFANFDKALIMLYEYHLLQIIFPDLKEITLEELKIRAKKIPLFPKEAPVISMIYELFPKTTLAERLVLCDYLKLSNQDKLFTEELEMWRKTSHYDTYDWVKVYAKPHVHICKQIFALHTHDTLFIETHDALIKVHEEAIGRARAGKTVVTSEDFIRLGIKPGPELGSLLKQAERFAVNHALTDKAEILCHLQNAGFLGGR